MGEQQASWKVVPMAGETRGPRMTFGSVTVEADVRELLEHLDTPSLMHPFLLRPPRDDPKLYMECVEELRDSVAFLANIPQLECCRDEAEKGRALLKDALGKLQSELAVQLSSSAVPLQKATHFAAFGGWVRERASKDGQADGRGEVGGGTPADDALPELVPVPAANTMATIADCLTGAGHGKECCDVYREQRMAWLASVLEEMETFVVLNPDVVALPWDRLHESIRIWNDHMRMLCGLAPLEAALAARVLRSVGRAQRGAVVADLAMKWLRPLLEIGTLVAESRKAPEKLLSLLDMIECLQEVCAVLHSSFPDPIPPDPASSPVAAVESLLKSVRAAASDTAAQFVENVRTNDIAADAQQQQQQQEQQQHAGVALHVQIPSDPTTLAISTSPSGGSGSGRGQHGSGKPRPKALHLFGQLRHSRRKGDAPEMPRADIADGPSLGIPPSSSSQAGAAGDSDGDVQQITKYVSNFIWYMTHRELPYVGLLDTILGSHSAVCQWLRNLLGALRSNLEAKSAAMLDDRLHHLFLMNNLNYIVTKLTLEEAVELLGHQWFEDTKGQLEKHRDWFLNAALQKFEIILSTDLEKDYGLFRDRLQAFNDTFEELCQRQRVWKVPNRDLCSLIRVEETTHIGARYREFLNAHRSLTDSGRSPKLRLMPVADVEQRLAEGFPERRKGVGEDAAAQKHRQPPTSSKVDGFQG